MEQRRQRRVDPASTQEVTMRALFAALAAAVMTSLATPTVAQSTNAQQERMKACNTQAGAEKLTGDARKSFMSDCLAGKTTAGSGSSAGTTQQELMKACNTEAGAQKLTGDARKSFMSSCLKGR
jgi:hypothetical protein